MPNDRYRLNSLLAAVMAIIAFLLLSSVAVIWANGLRYNPQSHKFEQTTVLAIDEKLEDVQVKVNGELVATKTPWHGRSLSAGQYKVTIEKTGFYPYEKSFTLSPSQVGLVNNLTFIANPPRLRTVETAVLPSTDLIDAQLSLINGELLDQGRLVTRFSQEPTQVHRFNDNYLYQQNGQLRLFVPASSQDFLLFTLKNNLPVPIKIFPGAWQVMFQEEGVTQMLELTEISEVSPGSRQ